jgi:predicted MFS family arabinose efflux permease
LPTTHERASLRTTLTASGALTTAMLPVFLLGALSEQVRAELGFDEAAVGAVVTVLFVTVGVAAAAVSRVTERIGAGTALRTGVAVSGLTTAAIGALASSWWHLAVGFAIVAFALILIDTGAARAFSEGVARDRQGSAFGLKEASVPAASLLAGVALPTVGVAFGWRATFVGAIAVAVVVLALLPRRVGPGAGARDASVREVETIDVAAADVAAAEVAAPEAAMLASSARRVRWFAAGVGVGGGAATAAATFLAPSVSARGLSTAAAGTTLVVASVASIVVRIGSGRWADRPGSATVRATSLLLAVGAVGAVVLALPVPAPLAVVGAVALLGGGWGWTGLAFLSVVRAHAGAPAVAAGIVLTGIGIGGAAGPPAFGALASRVSYTAAWAATAGALALASAVTAASVRPR